MGGWEVGPVVIRRCQVHCWISVGGTHQGAVPGETRERRAALDGFILLLGQLGVCRKPSPVAQSLRAPLDPHKARKPASMSILHRRNTTPLLRTDGVVDLHAW